MRRSPERRLSNPLHDGIESSALFSRSIVRVVWGEMSPKKKSGFNTMMRVMADLNREAERTRRAALRQQTEAARAAERAQRARERAAAASEKERARLHAEARAAEAAHLTAEIEQSIASVTGVLVDATARSHAIDFEELKRPPEIPPFDPQGLDRPEPQPEMAEPEFVAPPPPTLPEAPRLGGLRHGAAARHAEEVARMQAEHEEEVRAARSKHDEAVQRARLEHEEKLRAHAEREQARLTELKAKEAEHDRLHQEVLGAAREQHEEIDALRRDFESGDAQAIAAYFSLVLRGSAYPDVFPEDFDVTYLPTGAELLIERELPPSEIVAAIRGHKYTKTRDEIDQIARPATERKSLYRDVICQVVLRCIHEVLDADTRGVIQAVGVNGYVEGVDKSTGQPSRVYLVSARVPREVFVTVAPEKVDAAECLAGLGAQVSRNPLDASPVETLFDFEGLKTDAYESSIGL
jgi:restriction system protein